MESNNISEEEVIDSEGSQHSESEEYHRFQSLLPFNPQLSLHPIFQFKNDDLLSVIIEPLEALIKISPNTSVIKAVAGHFKDELFGKIFSRKKIADLNREFKSLGLSHKTICGKLIPFNDIYFRCLDCDVHENPAFISLLCTDCFEKSNHEGHRILLVKKENNSSATCDCGDAEVFNTEGFCADHRPQEIDNEVLLSRFPKEIYHNCHVFLKKAFFGAISLFEIAQKSRDEFAQKTLFIFANQSLDELLTLCISMYSEIDNSFLSILGIILQDHLQGPHTELWHSCEDLKAENKIQQVDVNLGHPCTCTILGNLLRLGNVMGPAQQSKLHKILVECSKQTTFKEFLLLEFTKYIHFLYSQSYKSDDNEDNMNSRLLNMKTQLYSRDAFLLKVLDSGNFDNMVSVMKRVIHSAEQANHEVYHIMADLRSAILYFLNPKYKAAERLLKETDLFNELTDVLTNFQMKFIYEGEIKIGLYEHNIVYRSINCGLMIEKVICQTLEGEIRLICKSQDQKAVFAKNFMAKLYESFQISKEILDYELNSGGVSFHPGLERTICYLIRNYIGSNALQEV